MTTRFSWEMDFGDDDFATAADVSLDVQNYRLRIALDTEQDEAEFVDIAAVGRLVLTNKSRNYSPDSLTSPYAAALRAPHACRRVGRFTVSGTTHTEVLWEGTAHAPTLTGLTGIEFAEFDLRGALVRGLRRRVCGGAAWPVRTLADVVADARTFAAHTPSPLGPAGDAGGRSKRPGDTGDGPRGQLSCLPR